MDFKGLHLLLRLGREYGHGRIREKGLTDTEHMICSYVYVNESCSQDDIARSVGMDKTTVGKAVDSLVGKCFLTREQSRRDKRKNVLSLTEMGRESIADILSINDEWMKSILSVLSDEERARFMEYLDRVLYAAKKLYSEKEENRNA